VREFILHVDDGANLQPCEGIREPDDRHLPAAIEAAFFDDAQALTRCQRVPVVSEWGAHNEYGDSDAENPADTGHAPSFARGAYAPIARRGRDSAKFRTVRQAEILAEL